MRGVRLPSSLSAISYHGVMWQLNETINLWTSLNLLLVSVSEARDVTCADCFYLE